MSDAPKLIADMQKDTAAAKRLLLRIASNADKLAAIDREASNEDAEAYAMEWGGSVRQAHGIILSAHGYATRGLAKHYPGTRGPGGR